MRGTRAARNARDLEGRAIDGRASTQPRESRARAGAARARLATRARAPGGPTGKIAHPLNSDLSRPRKVGCARVWPYRRVEPPRGVRRNLGSNGGGTYAPRERRGWFAKKSYATRDEVSVERASRENLSPTCLICGTDSAGRSGSRPFDLHRRRAPRWISVGPNADVSIFDQSRAFLSTRNELENAPNASSFDRLPRAGGS